VLTRLLSERLYPGPRDIFITNVMHETKAVYGNTERINSPYGHIVIRVEPGVDTYRVFILDDSNESFKVECTPKSRNWGISPLYISYTGYFNCQNRLFGVGSKLKLNLAHTKAIDHKLSHA